jgi:hypothetical protein
LLHFNGDMIYDRSAAIGFNKIFGGNNKAHPDNLGKNMGTNTMLSR